MSEAEEAFSACSTHLDGYHPINHAKSIRLVRAFTRGTTGMRVKGTSPSVLRACIQSIEEMSCEKIEECLDLLRQADQILMDENELALAAHLSLVIERLAMRLPGYVPSENQDF